MATIHLAPLTTGDQDEFLAAAAASRHLHGRWVSPPQTPEKFQALVARRQGLADLGFLIRRSSDGALTGYVEVTNIVRGNFRSAFLGYYAFSGHERQGLMSEGLRLLVRRAFGEMGLHRLEANIQPGNLASIALVRSCGFTREGYSERYLKIRGRWRDHERWAIVAS